MLLSQFGQGYFCLREFSLFQLPPTCRLGVRSKLFLGVNVSVNSRLSLYVCSNRPGCTPPLGIGFSSHCDPPGTSGMDNGWMESWCNHTIAFAVLWQSWFHKLCILFVSDQSVELPAASGYSSRPSSVSAEHILHSNILIIVETLKVWLRCVRQPQWRKTAGWVILTGNCQESTSFMVTTLCSSASLFVFLLSICTRLSSWSSSCR